MVKDGEAAASAEAAGQSGTPGAPTASAEEAGAQRAVPGAEELRMTRLDFLSLNMNSVIITSILLGMAGRQRGRVAAPSNPEGGGK